MNSEHDIPPSAKNVEELNASWDAKRCAQRLRRIYPPEIAYEATQGAYIRLRNKEGHIPTDRRYVMSIARFEALNILRDQKKREERERLLAYMGGEKSSDPAVLVEIQDTLKALHQCISSLPPRLKQVIEIYAIQKLPRKQVARELGLTVETVSSYLGNAQKELRSCMERKLNPKTTRREGRQHAI